MRKHITYSLFTFLLLSIIRVCAIAQTQNDSTATGPAVVVADTANIVHAEADPRSISDSTLNRYKKAKDYQYDYTPPEQSTSFWERFFRWLNNLFSDIEAPGNPSSIFDFISYIIIAFAIGMIVYLIVKGNFTGIIRGSAKKTGIEYTVEEVDLDALNFDELISEALKDKDYRKVVRLYYLQTLKILTDKNLIEFKADKTNADYMRELKKSDVKPAFARLTYVYEYVWYGHFEINESGLSDATKVFNEFKSSVKS